MHKLVLPWAPWGRGGRVSVLGPKGSIKPFTPAAEDHTCPSHNIPGCGGMYPTPSPRRGAPGDRKPGAGWWGGEHRGGVPGAGS